MQVVIRSKDFELTEALRGHVERRVQFALSWAADYVRKVTVSLLDINGPRGGTDKRCQIKLTMPGVADVVIEDTEADLYIAIDRAADRARYTLVRRVDRQRKHRGMSVSEATIDAFRNMSLVRRKLS